jgi:hypothetical protein
MMVVVELLMAVVELLMVVVELFPSSKCQLRSINPERKFWEKWMNTPLNHNVDYILDYSSSAVEDSEKSNYNRSKVGHNVSNDTSHNGTH